MHSAVRLLAELRRRKVARVAVAYGVVAWVVVQIAETVFEPLLLPDWALTMVVVLAFLGFPLAVALAWAFELTPAGVRKEIARTETDNGPAAAAISAPAASTTAPAPVAPPTASVAVLPFVDLSETQDQAYFCDGVAEEILNSLTKVSGLSVAARAS
jgi:hypothetical protein